MRGAFKEFPATGAFRVHREPRTRVSRTRPRDRFDDPENEYAVWYFASTLKAALIEVMDHFRMVDRVEEALGAVAGVDGFDVLDEEFAGTVPEKFFTSQRVVECRLVSAGSGRFVELMDEELLADLTLRKRVREALAEGGEEAFGPNPSLNFGNVQAASRAARRVTQAVSRELFDESDYGGIAYISRHTRREECWAVFDADGRPAVFEFSEPIPLDGTVAAHREAVHAAAELLRLRLPPGWS